MTPNDMMKLLETLLEKYTLECQAQSTGWCPPIQCPNREITDTERLEFLMQFFTVWEEYDPLSHSPRSPKVRPVIAQINKAFNEGAVDSELFDQLHRWINPDMRRVIDKAIRYNCR